MADTDEQKPPLTLEQQLRLEKIFMPQAMRQRQQAGYSDETSTPIRFVHYTSADAAIKIIQSKRMWMRNTMCMADYREVQHGYELMKSFFSEANTASFVSALEKCHPNALRDADNAFVQWWDRQRLETYITSISEHDEIEDVHGRLSMWRAFGSSPARVALVFRLPYMSEGTQSLNLLFSPVSYLNESETHEVMGEVVSNVEADVEFLKSIGRGAVVNMILYMLLTSVVCLKHEGFREEREWRAIYLPMTRPSSLMKSSVETVAGVPQTIYHIPLDASFDARVADIDFAHILDRVIIGPTQYPLAMQVAFQSKLNEAGCPNVPVVMSQIPLRT